MSLLEIPTTTRAAFRRFAASGNVRCATRTFGARDVLARRARLAAVVALLHASAHVLPAAELWVAPDGSDAARGTREEPFASLHTALRQARERRRLDDPSVSAGVRIILRGGIYRLHEPVLIHQEDSGTAEHPLVIAAAPGEQPVLSGGVPVTGWRKLERDDASAVRLPSAARGAVWVADAPRFNGRLLEFRQLWVNGVKAVRAREPDDGGMVRLTGWDRAGEVAALPASAVPDLRSPHGVELLIHQQWEIAILRLRDIALDGADARLRFHAPESRIQFEHPWPQPIFDPDNPARNSGCVFVSALELLDQPGEWHQELPGGRIYYWPRADEDLARDAVIAPALETLVRVGGTVDRPVRHVVFEGITFTHATWLRPSQLGHVPHQAGMFMRDAYKLRPKGTPEWRSLDNQAWVGRPPAAVAVQGARHVRFTRCRFEHLAMSGLDFVGGTSDDVVEGCVFCDIGGNGIQMGQYGDAGFEVHLPYDPRDARVVCTRGRIANNLFVDTANEDWGCIALSVGWAREVTIAHNEIRNTSYTGISVGWGWTRTPGAASRHVIRANRIERFATRMADCGGIYLLAAQPHTLVAENVIEEPVMSEWVHDPDHWGYIYLDEGSSFTTVRDNWCAGEKFIANANGPGNRWENNGPAVDEAIRARAGLEPEFQDLREVVYAREDG